MAPKSLAGLRVCWPDDDYDRDYASDRRSRYGAYLRSHTEHFAGWYPKDEAKPTRDPVRFAAGAFTVATGPIMWPGYLCFHPRVIGHHAECSTWDGRLLLSITLLTLPPLRLPSELAWRTWHKSWLDQWEEPGQQHPAALPSLLPRWPIAPVGLPKRAATRASVQDVADAKRAARAVAAEINRTVGPILAALEDQGGERR